MKKKADNSLPQLRLRFWLKNKCIEKAEKIKDRFNLCHFKHLDIRNWSISDHDGCVLYIEDYYLLDHIPNEELKKIKREDLK
jgi:hypothetical protein